MPTSAEHYDVETDGHEVVLLLHGSRLASLIPLLALWAIFVGSLILLPLRLFLIHLPPCRILSKLVFWRLHA